MKKVKFLMTLEDAHRVNSILASRYVRDSESEGRIDKKELKQLDRITDNLQNTIDRFRRDNK